MTAEVLRDAVHDRVGAELERALQRRRGERVVDHDLRARRVCDRGHGLDVDDLQQRVRRCLDPHEPRLGTDRAGERVGIGEVARRHLETPRAEHLGEQAVRAAVHVVGQHHVVAGPQRQQQRRLGGHPAREREPALAAFERGERAARAPRASGSPTARVVPHLRVADVVLGVRRGLIDRHVHRAEGGVGILPGVDRARLESVGPQRGGRPSRPASPLELLPARGRRRRPRAPTWTYSAPVVSRRELRGGPHLRAAPARAVADRAARSLRRASARTDGTPPRAAAPRRQHDHALRGVAEERVAGPRGRATRSARRARRPPGRACAAASVGTPCARRIALTPVALVRRRPRAGARHPAAPPRSRTGTPRSRVARARPVVSSGYPRAVGGANTAMPRSIHSKNGFSRRPPSGVG